MIQSTIQIDNSGSSYCCYFITDKFVFFLWKDEFCIKSLCNSMHRFDSAMRHVSFFYKISALSVISGLTVLNNYSCGEIEYSHQRIC